MPAQPRAELAGARRSATLRRLPTSVLALLFLGLAPSAPDAGAALIEAARSARAAGDFGRVDRALRGWATLGRDRPLPAGLEGEAAAAIAWASKAGLLRLYGSRLPGRARVGLDDPASLVARLDAFGIGRDGSRYRLTRAEGEVVGRYEFVVPPSASEHEIILEAVMIERGAEIVVKRAVLLPDEIEAPKPPAPKIAPVEPPPPSVEEDGAFAWWWIALGAVAAGLAGAAIWQETR
jgi:hypothetical protein